MKQKPVAKPDHIELNRFFIEWMQKNIGDPDEFARMLGAEHSLKWPALLTRRRVVVLAEAGRTRSRRRSNPPVRPRLPLRCSTTDRPWATWSS